MEKLFLPLVIAFLILSTMAISAIGEDHLSKRGDQQICVESRSCAINYMNKLRSEQE
jgi:hypothetical protein